MRPHRRQPTRLPRPWDSPGKNTRVGCHFLLQCMKVKSESEVAQLCPTLSDLMDCSLPGSSIHGIFQARALEWGHCLLRNVTLSPSFNVVVPDISHEVAALPHTRSGNRASRALVPGVFLGCKLEHSARANTQGLECHHFLPLTLHPQSYPNPPPSAALRQLPR